MTSLPAHESPAPAPYASNHSLAGRRPRRTRQPTWRPAWTPISLRRQGPESGSLPPQPHRNAPCSRRLTLPRLLASLPAFILTPSTFRLNRSPLGLQPRPSPIKFTASPSFPFSGEGECWNARGRHPQHPSPAVSTHPSRRPNSRLRQSPRLTLLVVRTTLSNQTPRLPRPIIHHLPVARMPTPAPPPTPGPLPPSISESPPRCVNHVPERL